ncbi:MAG: hypothetical protein R6V30_10055 [Paracoccaceae bacterium]
MTKTLALTLFASLSLSACVGIDGGPSVTRDIVDHGLSCPSSPHMVTTSNLPVRCGPQRPMPYSMN